jgi:hypothetical protein
MFAMGPHIALALYVDVDPDAVSVRLSGLVP